MTLYDTLPMVFLLERLSVIENPLPWIMYHRARFLKFGAVWNFIGMKCWCCYINFKLWLDTLNPGILFQSTQSTVNDGWMSMKRSNVWDILMLLAQLEAIPNLWADDDEVNRDAYLSIRKWAAHTWRMRVCIIYWRYCVNLKLYPTLGGMFVY